MVSADVRTGVGNGGAAIGRRVAVVVSSDVARQPSEGAGQPNLQLVEYIAQEVAQEMNYHQEHVLEDAQSGLRLQIVVRPRAYLAKVHKRPEQEQVQQKPHRTGRILVSTNLQIIHKQFQHEWDDGDYGYRNEIECRQSVGGDWDGNPRLPHHSEHRRPS